MATPTRVDGRQTASDAEVAGGPTRHVRTVVVVACLAAVAVLFGAVARQSMTSTSQAAAIVRLEASGAEMMHPMTTLLTELVTAQSAAVRGAEVDQASVRSAVAAVQEADAQYGVELQTRQRLQDLDAQIEAAFRANETGRDAYQRYSSIVDLAIDLIRVIGDSSHLVHDPDLDSYYLMDAALVRLPDAMVYAGRAADLVALAGSRTDLTGEDAVRAAVARFNVSYDAEKVARGLTTSVNFTERAQLGSNFVERLDAFRTAANAFAPPTMLQDLATPVQARAMAENAVRVFTAAQSLAHLLLGELEELLAARAENLAQQQRFTVIATAAALLVGIVIVWLLVVSSRRTATARDASDREVLTGRAKVPAPVESPMTGPPSPAERWAAAAPGRELASGIPGSHLVHEGARSGHAR